MAGFSLQGIRRAAIAALALSIPSAAIADPHRSCAHADIISPAGHWRMIRFILNTVTLDGPPEMKAAAAALNAGDYDLALQRLDQAASYVPSNVARRAAFYPPFLNAVLTARILAWQLRGCPLTQDGKIPVLF